MLRANDFGFELSDSDALKTFFEGEDTESCDLKNVK